MDPDTLDFGTAIHSLLWPDGKGLETMPLVPSSPRECPQLEMLRSMSNLDLFDGAAIRSADDADCVRSGLLLYFSALDESHTISQRIHTVSGSYWHGIMHRQEGDWGNAKYWFRRVGTHPVFTELERELGERWDPFAFVDRCAAAHARQGSRQDLLRRQMVEWRLLMEYCYLKALGR